LTPIGSGAMGTVFAAFDALRRAPVAIKVLPAGHASSDEIDYFKLEFQTVVELEHPNLVKVFDFGQTPTGELYYSMQYLADGSLASLPLPLDQDRSLTVTVQLCRALQYIHSRGIIHRDIKPANVLLDGRPDADGIGVKLTDFGLASLPKAAAGSSPPGGTPAYAAPEALAGSAVDFRADLFSLGVLIYELCTGRLPFSWQGGGIAEVPLPTSLNPMLSKEIDTLLLKLLEIDPSNRYREANSVIDGVNHLFGRSFDAETESTGTSYILSPALVGRDKELHAIRTELSAMAGIPMGGDGEAQGLLGGEAEAAGAEVPAPRAGVILVSGPTGIGKTRLVQETKLFCQLNGIRFCLGQGVGGSSMPGEPIAQAVGSLLSAIPDGQAPVLGPILAPFIQQGGRSRQSQSGDRSSFAESVYQFMRSAAESSPTVLCVEDVQWADPLTVAAINHLARGFFPTPLGEPALDAKCRLLITVDDSGALTREQKALLKELSAEALTMRLSPESLSAGQIAQVVASMFGPQALPDGAAEKLREATSGLPALLQQLMAELLHRGALTQKLGRWRLAQAGLDSLPPLKGMRERAETLMAGLPPEERAIVEAASVLVSPAGAGEISRLAGLPYSATRDALRDLSRRTLLVERRGQFALPSGPLRDNIYALVHWKRRRGLHHEAALMTEAKRLEPRSRIHTLAHHYLLARDRENALKWGLAAARDSTKAQAHSEAASYYRQLLAQDIGPELRPEILVEYGQSLASLGKSEQAIRRYREAYDLVSSTDPALRVKLQRLMGDAYSEAGKLSRARQWLNKAARNQGVSRREAAQASAALAFIEHSSRRPAAAEECLRRAHRALRHAGTEHELKCRVYRITGLILTDKGDFAGAIPHLKRALREARAARSAIALMRSYSALGIVYHSLYRHGDSLRAAQAAMKIARRMAIPGSIGTQLMNIGAILFDRGEYVALNRDLLEASSLFWRTGSLRLYSQCLTNLGLIKTEIGDYEEALDYLDRALSIQTENGYSVLAATSRSVMISTMLHTGRISDAVDLAASILRQAKRTGSSREHLMALKDMGDALLADGRADEAATPLRDALRGFRRIGEKDEVCECLTRLAAVEESRRDGRAAMSLSEEAVKLARSLRSKPILLKALLSTTPRYAAEVSTIRRLASQIESPELRWRAHAACAEHFIGRGKMAEGLDEYGKCLGVFRSVTADIRDPSLRETYINHPQRLEVLSRMQALGTTAGAG
jgi:tetratricopeptide (TPR) repeat protein